MLAFLRFESVSLDAQTVKPHREQCEEIVSRSTCGRSEAPPGLFVLKYYFGLGDSSARLIRHDTLDHSLFLQCENRGAQHYRPCNKNYSPFTHNDHLLSFGARSYRQYENSSFAAYIKL